MNILKFWIAYLKNNLQSAMEYRASFVIQTIGMFVNDLCWIIMWMIVFERFGVIGSWGFSDMLLLYIILTASWGLAGIFFGYWMDIADIIIRGKLDFYLAMPKPALLHVLISKIHLSAVGDLIFGLALIPFAGLNPGQALLAIFFTFSAALILVSFGVIANSLAFFVSGTGELFDTLLSSAAVFSSYPFSIFNDTTKMILLTLVPAGFITGLPVEVIKNFNLTSMVCVVIASIAFFMLAYSIFHIGLRKYESGNLMYAKM